MELNIYYNENYNMRTRSEEKSEEKIKTQRNNTEEYKGFSNKQLVSLGCLIRLCKIKLLG